MHRILTLLLALLATALPAAEDLAGTWENIPNQFNSVHFSLRKDGRGVYESGARMDLTWKRTKTGITMKMGEDRVYKFLYDSANGTLTEEPDPEQTMSNTVYRKVSDIQTKLINPEIEGDDPDEKEDGPAGVAYDQPQTNKREFKSTDNILQEIGRKLAARDSSLSFISLGKPAREFTVRKLARSCIIELYLVTKSVDKPTPHARRTQVDLSANPQVPIRYSVATDRATALRGWLTVQKIKFIEQAFQTEANGRIESYERQMIITCGTDTKAATQVVDYLLKETFKGAGKPFQLDEMLRE